MIRVREFSGPAAGPHLLIFGAIHGNEVCGTHALQKLEAELDSGSRSLLRGRLTIVPICNERAFTEKVRYVDENLNRVFRSHAEANTHERRIANQLIALVEGADYFLDLHSMQSAGDPFAFLNGETAESEAFCRNLGIKWILKGWPDLYRAFPDQLSSCTQTYADSHGKPNALIECGTHGAAEADEVAYEAVLRTLSYLKMVGETWPPLEQPASCLRLTDLWIRESKDDRFVKTWRNFEAVKKGEIVAYRADGRPMEFPRDGHIVFPSPISAVGTEWFYAAVAE